MTSNEMSNNQMKGQIKATVDARAGELAEISRWMYENPEIAYQERESSARLAGFLKENGFEVEYPAYGLETAFVARAGQSGPEVIICAEYDALPGVGHACGHNIIATSALGAGLGLLEAAEKLGFRVTVLGTPAEEKYGGKVDLINAGAFADAKLAMMVHPSTHDVVDPPVISVAHIDAIFWGKTAHASAYPFLGINALDAFVQSYVNVSTLRQQLEPTDKVHGIVTHGGDAPNIIPGHTRSSWYVRAPQQDRLDVLLPRVLACFEAAATATGCRLEIERVGHTYEDLTSNEVLVEIFAANADALGRPMMRGFELPPTVSGSTDMGNVSKLVPTIHPMISIDSSPAVNHHRVRRPHHHLRRREGLDRRCGGDGVDRFRRCLPRPLGRAVSVSPPEGGSAAAGGEGGDPLADGVELSVPDADVDPTVPHRRGRLDA